jgi:hypothetical protein
MNIKGIWSSYRNGSGSRIRIISSDTDTKARTTGSIVHKYALLGPAQATKKGPSTITQSRVTAK